MALRPISGNSGQRQIAAHYRPEGDFRQLRRESQPRHAYDIAGALRLLGAVHFLPHFSTGSESRIDIQDIQGFLDHVIERRTKLGEQRDGIPVGLANLLLHLAEIHRLPASSSAAGATRAPS